MPKVSRKSVFRLLGIVVGINLLFSLFLLIVFTFAEAFSMQDFGNGMILMAIVCLMIGASAMISASIDPRQAGGGSSGGGYTPPLEPHQIERLSQTMTENMREGRRSFLYAASAVVLSLSIGLIFNFLQ